MSPCQALLSSVSNMFFFLDYWTFKQTSLHHFIVCTVMKQIWYYVSFIFLYRRSNVNFLKLRRIVAFPEYFVIRVCLIYQSIHHVLEYIYKVVTINSTWQQLTFQLVQQCYWCISSTTKDSLFTLIMYKNFLNNLIFHKILTFIRSSALVLVRDEGAQCWRLVARCWRTPHAAHCATIACALMCNTCNVHGCIMIWLIVHCPFLGGPDS